MLLLSEFPIPCDEPGHLAGAQPPRGKPPSCNSESFFMRHTIDLGVDDTRINSRIRERLTPFLGIIVLAEIGVAVVAVVGIFMSLSQAPGWQSGLAILLFASMLVLLWFADASMNFEGDSGAQLQV